MKEKLNDAIEVLLEQLQEQMQQAADTKRMINALRMRMGEEATFADVSVEQAGSMSGRRDQFYGKPLATAVTGYLERRKQASTTEEILRGLEQGGFDFRAHGWKDNDRLRSLAIYLVKNTKTFHRLPNRTFGLLGWYDQTIIKAAMERPLTKRRKENGRKRRKRKKKVVESLSPEGAPEQEKGGEL